MMRWLSRTFWLAAWSFWLWLGFGLYRELPRDLGPVACRLPLGKYEDPIGFIDRSSTFATREVLVAGESMLLRLWDVPNGTLQRSLKLPPLPMSGNNYLFRQHGLLLVVKPTLGYSVYDVVGDRWVEMPKNVARHGIASDRPSLPWIVFDRTFNFDDPAAPGGTGVSIVDLRRKELLFNWECGKREGKMVHLTGSPKFMGDEFVLLPTMTRTADGRREFALEVWPIRLADRPVKRLTNLDAITVAASERGRIALDQKLFVREDSTMKSCFLDVYDIWNDAYVFSNPPRSERDLSSLGKLTSEHAPYISQDGRRVLTVSPVTLWDVDLGKKLWASNDRWLNFAGWDGERFSVAERWSTKHPLWTYAVRSVRTGELVHRCWNQTSIDRAFVSDDESMLFDSETNEVRSLPPLVNYPLLALCQTILALPLVLLWAALRWRRKRTTRSSVQP